MSKLIHKRNKFEIMNACRVHVFDLAERVWGYLQRCSLAHKQWTAAQHKAELPPVLPVCLARGISELLSAILFGKHNSLLIALYFPFAWWVLNYSVSKCSCWMRQQEEIKYLRVRPNCLQLAGGALPGYRPWGPWVLWASQGFLSYIQRQGPGHLQI